VFWIGDWHLDTADPGDRAIQIIKRAFHDLCGYFGGKTAGTPSFVDHDRTVRFPHGGQDRRDVEWPEYPEINDLGRDALLCEPVCRLERLPERAPERNQRDVCSGSSDCRLCQIDGKGALVEFTFKRIQVSMFEDKDRVRFPE